MKIENDYSKATEVEFGLFAVCLSDGGWSISDGKGTVLTPEDEIELSGYHLPVRFESEDSAIKCIQSGPHEMFDINVESIWTKHAVRRGGIIKPSYLI